MFHALVDGDVLVYRTGFASQHNAHLVYIKDDEESDFIYKTYYKRELNEWLENNNNEGTYRVTTETEVEKVEYALYSVKQTIRSILRATEASDFTIYLSGATNFREGVAKTKPYKGNRKDLQRPIHYDAIREYLIGVWGAKVVEGIEADDALGIHHYQFWERSAGHLPYAEARPEELGSILCTIDKDLMMIPGWHYNFVREEKYYVTKSQATRNFYIQLLTGDPTDNIKGIPRVGPAKAKKILEGCSTIEEYETACVYAYRDYYGEEGDTVMEEMRQLVWILREPRNET